MIAINVYADNVNDITPEYFKKEVIEYFIDELNQRLDFIESVDEDPIDYNVRHIGSINIAYKKIQRRLWLRNELLNENNDTFYYDDENVIKFKTSYNRDGSYEVNIQYAGFGCDGYYEIIDNEPSMNTILTEYDNQDGDWKRIE